EDLASWYRRQLLTNDQGGERVTEDLRRRLAESDASESPKLHHALESALKYLENRPAQLHPGSHWSPQGLRGAMTARGLQLSDRWDSAFESYHRALQQEVRCF
ncbi:MAG: hypothetical protein V3V08_11070, partial [Nannocystaceae bacterium]